MKAIVAVDLNWGIGYKGNLLLRIPDDMKFFKEMTIGKVVIMGRETFESLPGKQPLKDRTNIILSRKENFNRTDALLCRSIKELFDVIKKYNTDDIFVIGGEAVYNQLLPYCSEAYVTKIEEKFQADKYFINLDKLENWKAVSSGEWKSYNGVRYRIVNYVNHEELAGSM